MALRLAAHVHGVCGQLSNLVEPLLVKLAKGKVSGMISRDAALLLGDLHLDPALGHSSCVSLALSASLDLAARFKEYEEYPCAACLLCRTFNSDFGGLSRCSTNS